MFIYIYVYKYIYIYPSDRLETSRWYPGTPVSIFFRPNTRYICVGFHYFQERWQGEIVHGLFQCFQITVPGIQRCSFYSVTNVSPWQAVAQAVTASNMLPLWNRIHTWYTPERLMLCRKSCLRGQRNFENNRRRSVAAGMRQVSGVGQTVLSLLATSTLVLYSLQIYMKRRSRWLGRLSSCLLNQYRGFNSQRAHILVGNFSCIIFD